jgi:hypothetical protein
MYLVHRFMYLVHRGGGRCPCARLKEKPRARAAPLRARAVCAAGRCGARSKRGTGRRRGQGGHTACVRGRGSFTSMSIGIAIQEHPPINCGPERDHGSAIAFAGEENANHVPGMPSKEKREHWHMLLDASLLQLNTPRIEGNMFSIFIQHMQQCPNAPQRWSMAVSALVIVSGLHVQR